jgi:hypothetical protein
LALLSLKMRFRYDSRESGRVGGVKRFFACVLLLLAAAAGAQERVEREFPSPDGGFVIRYSGMDRFGEGAFSFERDGKTVELLKSYLRYGPMVNWLSDRYAEIKVPTGSPDSGSYVFDRDRSVLSKWYSLPIAIDANGSYIACLDDEGILVFEIFSGRLVRTIPVPGLEPLSFLVFCSPKGEFIDSNAFRLEWWNPDEKTQKKLEVPIAPEAP